MFGGGAEDRPYESRFLYGRNGDLGNANIGVALWCAHIHLPRPDPPPPPPYSDTLDTTLFMQCECFTNFLTEHWLVMDLGFWMLFSFFSFLPIHIFPMDYKTTHLCVRMYPCTWMMCNGQRVLHFSHIYCILYVYFIYKTRIYIQIKNPNIVHEGGRRAHGPMHNLFDLDFLLERFVAFSNIHKKPRRRWIG